MMKKITLLSAVMLTLATLTLSAQDRSDTIHVAHYDISLTVMDFTTRNIVGETQLTVVAKMSNLNQVVLDLLALTTDSVKVNGSAATFQHQGERLSITVPTMQAGDIRRFALDADLVLGALRDSATLVVIGREREMPLEMLPPLRVETILLIASISSKELSQSLDINDCMAGKMGNGRD